MTLSKEIQQFSPEHAVAVLTTRRLILRAPRHDDAEAIATLINDRRIAENTARVPHPYERADADRFIATANQSDETTFVVTLADGTLIGGCGVGVLTGIGDPEPGYWIGSSYWGKGYATEAARALVDHAFGPLGHERLQARARVTNAASRRVLEKCGFQWTGAGLIRVRALGCSVPVDRFRLDRSLWASLKDWGSVSKVA